MGQAFAKGGLAQAIMRGKLIDGQPAAGLQRSVQNIPFQQGRSALAQGIMSVAGCDWVSEIIGHSLWLYLSSTLAGSILVCSMFCLFITSSHQLICLAVMAGE